MSYYYNSGFNYVPFTSSSYVPAQNQVVTQPQQTMVAETPQKESSSVNKDLLWAGIAGLAVLGTYLVTRGHYKAKIPTQATSNSLTPAVNQTTERAAQEVAEEFAKPIPESVNRFLDSYKPFSGVDNVAEGVMPKITQVGSRTRAEYLTTVNGEQVKDIIIFNDKGNAVSRFLETTKPNNRNGVDRVRQAFRLNSNGEQELVQTSTRRKGDLVVSSNGQKRSVNSIKDGIEIENHGVNKTPENLPDGSAPDPNSNVKSVSINRYYDKTSGRLVNYSNSRTYVNSKGEEIYTCFDNSRFFAYDNNGKLIGILEQNPKKAFMGDDYAYHVVENGEIVNTSPANKFDLSVIRHGGTYKYTDGKNHHTLSDEQLANFADYYSSRQYLD
uniref:hypothetical protein n=1 Tax=Candidatus Stercorousia sp. TaxID=3048886 RepID=UPI00402653CA